MSKLDHLFTEFYHLGEDERQQFLKTVVQDSYVRDLGVESRPDVCDGDPCIIRTRIPVWTLVQSQRLGFSDAEILKSYPTLRAEDLANAWTYARRHPEEIDRQIHENETA
jgi:uncharacterized protein (DUF433 family)